MTLQQEARSWFAPTYKTEVESVPQINDQAPSSDALELPNADGRPTIVTFLRHCGCPFAEKTFIRMRESAAKHPNVRFIAVSHSDHASTEKWVEAIGGPGNVQVIVDPDRDLFARWGLGVSSFWHVLSPWALWSVYRLYRDEGIANRPTESGSRWQTAGSFGMDGSGKVKWGREALRADEIPDFEEAVRAVEGDGDGRKGEARGPRDSGIGFGQ
ncbi:hypothetical protein H2201_003006 [Coniosporium apollinis]|uniref:Thioredoxin domain-containing protein n=2 Tax=Coniosporium TaxID=2810619 RepID=A0ABQ9NWV9_9PEZI|nr:hypothetical protein H2199_007748 [Cladosporium sp. JES 115]KAJ9666872.1 hypothetical protein H2201_003006 [Coniosporium apollinis]